MKCDICNEEIQHIETYGSFYYCGKCDKTYEDEQKNDTKPFRFSVDIARKIRDKYFKNKKKI